MASTYEYIISLRDKASGAMNKIAAASSAAVSRVSAMISSTAALNTATAQTGGSIMSLRQKIEQLRLQKELLPASSLPQIRQYNREIAALERQVNTLDNAGNGGRLRQYFSGLGGMLKGLFNPVTLAISAAAGLGMLGGAAMKFDENMAKVNITAQLDEKGLSGLKNKLKGIADDNHADINIIPTGFEKIISQTGDVDSSLQILDASLKGAKAGFVDLDTVTGALSQTLSIVGKGNASAQEVLDTFFAAKRVGAGEFKDFAQYMPGLIAGADSLGVNYKSVAGIFAYMTGKGQDAARSSVLMGNMFSVLQKTDITSNLSKAGVKVFDMQGKMRGVVDIFKDLSGVMTGMSDQQKSGFLEKIGIVDKEAKSAFAIMSGDIEKLSTAMDATANSSGETAAALDFSKNTVQKATDLWNDFKNALFDMGQAALPAINFGIDLLSIALSSVCGIISSVTGFFSGWSDALREGSPLVWGLTAALGALMLGLMVYELWTNRAVVATKAKAAWDGIVSVATGAWTGVQWALNSALFACPLVWIVALVVGLIAAIVACCTKVQGWGRQWQVIVDFMKNVWDLFVETFRFRWTLMTNGVMLALDKIRLGWYKFKEACGLGDSSENQAMIAGINADVESRKQAIADGMTKIKDLAEKTKNSLSWELSWKKGEAQDGAKEETGTESSGISTETGGKAGGGNVPDFDALMKKMGGKPDNNGGNSGKALDLGKIISQEKGTTAYAAIAARLSTVKIPAPNVTTGETKINVAPQAASILQPNNNLPSLPEIADKTDYRDEKTDWLQAISANVEKITAGTGQMLSVMQRLSTTAAAILALNVASRPAALPALPGVNIPELSVAQPPARPEVSKQYNEENTYDARNTRSIHIDKYCDQVVINIQNADQRGQDEIETVIRKTLLDILDNYEA